MPSRGVRPYPGRLKYRAPPSTGPRVATQAEVVIASTAKQACRGVLVGRVNKNFVIPFATVQFQDLELTRRRLSQRGLWQKSYQQ